MMPIYSGVCRIYTPHHSVHLRYPCISVQPPSLLEYVPRGRDWASWEMHLEEIEIEWTQRCTWRPGSSEFGDALGDREIEWTQWCTWRPRSSELWDALGSHDRACWEIHLEAMIDQDGRSTWRWLIWRRLVWRQLIWRRFIWRRSIWRQSIWRQSIWRQSIWRQWIWKEVNLEVVDREACAMKAETLFIG